MRQNDTYRDLLRKLKTLSEEQLDMDLTLYSDGEYYPAEILLTDEDEDRLDPNHPYFAITDKE
jgi:hypothetical protein